MVKLMFACLNKLDSSLKCKNENCIFNSKGDCPKCEYFDDEEDTNLYILDKNKKELVCQKKF